MSSKVTCTCGWSWNKSDSSKKDMYVCHQCGKDNSMKDGGWLSKFDVPEAENGIEGTMAGLTDQGFNYNGAWGGTMAMGGSLPGSVGFTYARTQDPAPSKGKYAKKTMASAQKGKAITKREDFEPWWNWASVQAAGGERRQQTYGNLGDLYSYYAGQPLKHNVLEHSQYKPTDAKNPKAEYISINDHKFKQEVIDNYNRVFNEKKLLRDEKQINDNTYAVSGYTRPTKEQIKKSKSGELYYEKGKDHVSNAIGHYYLSKGKDEKGDYVSYYDVFDEGTGGSDGGGIGETLSLTKPFELYDRIYLDPKTGKPKMQNGGEMKFYQEGLDWKPKTISRDGGWLGKYEDGGIIEDNRGQWEHPGEITKINSNQITMQGVDYPVLGISDTGDTQMMYPGQDYTYEGESVTEVPMMQDGGRTEKINSAIGKGTRAASNFFGKLIAPFTPDYKSVEEREEIFKRHRPVEYPGFRNSLEGLLNPENTAAPGQDLEGKLNMGEEAWRKALDLPTEENYIVSSKYKPTKAKNPNEKYFTLKNVIDEGKIIAEAKKLGWKPGAKYNIPSLAPFVKKGQSFSTNQGFSDIDPLQGFQIDIDPKGEYVSIYDKYDFDFEPLNKVIKPFEIYDRFYLPKSTFPTKKENGGWLSKYN